MYTYRAPLRDIRFVVHDVLDFEQNYRAYGREDLNRELLEGILEEGARFAEDVLAPTNRVGDVHGLVFENGEVKTPPGFKEAYDRYCEDGWITMTADPAVGRPGPAERFLARLRRDARVGQHGVAHVLGPHRERRAHDRGPRQRDAQAGLPADG